MLIFFLYIEVLAVLEFDECPVPFSFLSFEFGKSFLPLPQSQILLLNCLASFAVTLDAMAKAPEAFGMFSNLQRMYKL